MELRYRRHRANPSSSAPAAADRQTPSPGRRRTAKLAARADPSNATQPA
ncbi:hypothetical protein [Kribbella catacumbae]|nr:hypothetical protein [Kribbella catacumbae]